MVRAIAAGAWAYIKRVSEIVPEAITKSAHFKPSQKAPVAEVAELANCDTIIVGTRTRSDACHRKWLPSSIKQVDFGRAALSTARSVSSLRQPDGAVPKSIGSMLGAKTVTSTSLAHQQSLMTSYRQSSVRKHHTLKLPWTKP